jgi:hypothetical protein
MRPYILEKVAPTLAAASTITTAPPPPAAPSDLPGSIRRAVIAKLGTQVDPALLDSIIERVLKSTGLK